MRLVLDTHVLLDFWVFEDRAIAPLLQALRRGEFTALRSAATDAEFAAVLARPRFGLDARRQRNALATWHAHARCVHDVPPAPMRCDDPDDQKFLDLAFASAATALLTRDKALLRLSRAAARAKLWIGTPAGFSLATAQAGTVC